jgi:hypothetical protein
MAKSPGGKTDGKRSVKLNMGAATDKLAELAHNPLARSMLAAGLVAAAAALTSNEKVRQSAKKAGREALEGAEAAADSASKIGAAIVTAATEAVRRMMVSPSKGKSGRAAPAKKPAKAKTTKAKAARAPAKTAAGSKPKTKASKRTAGAARKSASAKAATAAKPAKSAPRPRARAGVRRGKAKAGA